MNKNVFIVGGIALVLIILAGFKLASNKQKVEGKVYIHDAEAPVLVKVSHPSQHTFDSEFNYLGTFEPFRQNVIGSEGSGRIIKLNIEEGSKVGQGTVLAKLDDEMLRLQIENLEVSIEGQKNDDQRYSTLSNQNAVPAVQAEKSKLSIRSSEIQKKQLQKQLAATQIKAPFGGVITKKLVDLGSVIGAGSPVVEITDISSLKLTVNVPERDILKFKMNQTVTINVDVLDESTLTGKVSNISVQADKSHNFKVQVLVKNPKQQLRAGMYGSATLLNSKKITAISVPRKALVGSMKNPQVYVVRNGKAKLVSFNSGTSDGEFIEVISGINASDIVIVKGQINLKDNSNIKISK